MPKDNDRSGWPKAPTRQAERNESDRKLRTARKLIAHLLSFKRKPESGGDPSSHAAK